MDVNIYFPKLHRIFRPEALNAKAFNISDPSAITKNNRKLKFDIISMWGLL